MAMPNRNYPESDPTAPHTQNIKEMLGEAAEHCREDIGKIDDPKAQALFETTRRGPQGTGHRVRPF